MAQIPTSENVPVSSDQNTHKLVLTFREDFRNHSNDSVN